MIVRERSESGQSWSVVFGGWRQAHGRERLRSGTTPPLAKGNKAIECGDVNVGAITEQQRFCAINGLPAAGTNLGWQPLAVATVPEGDHLTPCESRGLSLDVERTPE